MAGLLAVKGAVKRFGGLVAVNDVSLDIKQGSIVGLIGPNGSGKTTLFNVISGVFPPDSGEVYFDGERIDGLAPYEIYHRGLVRSFQIPRLFQKMTVLDNVMVAARNQIGDKLFNVPIRRRWMKQESDLLEKAQDILNFLDLGHLSDEPSTNISGGQLKLLEIGRALISDPKMLLFDEPAAGVNPAIAQEIFKKFVDLKQNKGLTFFIIEHRIELVLDFLDWMYVMHKGSIIAEGPPKEVVNNERVIKIYLGEA